ncbi:MAG: hypothetical protein II377_05250 [Clostridia bacterium]|nr:hypothetical protein [Clostridia bacterium]
MKKLLCVLIAATLVSALFLLPASANAKVVNFEVKGDNVAPLASDNLAELYDGAILSEADATAGDYNKAGIVLIQNKTPKEAVDCTIIFELETAQVIDTVYLYWFCHGNSMIGLPTDGALIVGTTTDLNAGFSEAAYEMDSTIAELTASFQRETAIELEAPVTAKYVSVTFTMGVHGYTGGNWDEKPCWEWVALTEVSAGLKAESDNGGGMGEVSQEESIDLDDIEPIVEIPAGVSFIKHVPFNKSIVTDSNTIITDPTNLSAYNVAWSACVLLRPTETEGQYSVVAVKGADGNYDFAFEGVQEGDIALAVHGESTEPAANKAALAALVEGDIVYFAGYDMANQTHETGAVVYYAVPAAGGEDTSDEVSDEVSEESTPADDESVPADDESTPADDSSAPATSDTDASDDKADEKSGNAGLIIGIVAGVVVIAVVVVVVVVVLKKKK